jgi:hypothetical protein
MFDQHNSKYKMTRGHSKTAFLRQLIKKFYNIAFVNSERWLAKSRVDITQ